MARIRVPQNSFTFGEVSPSLTSRTDSPIYKNAAEKVRNFFIRGEGGVTKRPGTKRWHNFASAPAYSSGLRQTVRIEPFIFSDDEQYIVAFSNTQIDVFQISPSDATISKIQTITSQTWLVNTSSAPYLEEYTFAQQGDIMFICHQTAAPRKLIRTGLTSFVVETFAFETSVDSNHVFQPYYPFQNLGTTIVSSSTGASVVSTTLTTSSNYFVSGHVGVYLKIGNTEALITAVANATTASATLQDVLRQQLNNDALKTAEGSGTIQVTHALHGLAVGASIVIDRAGTVGGVAITNINGSRNITAVVNENVYEFTAGSSATATSSADGGGAPRVATGSATTEWQEQSYSAVRGFPAAVTFHQNRLWFGGTLAQPDGIWGSKSGQYYNFDVGDASDNDSIDLTANVGEIFTIRHLVSNRDLQVFTTGAELFVQAPIDKPVTPANAQIRRQTPFGSSFVTTNFICDILYPLINRIHSNHVKGVNPLFWNTRKQCRIRTLAVALHAYKSLVVLIIMYLLIPTLCLHKSIIVPYQIPITVAILC